MNWLKRILRRWLNSNEGALFSYPTNNMPIGVGPGRTNNTMVQIQRVDNGTIISMEWCDKQGKHNSQIRLVFDGEDVFEVLKSMLVLKVLL